MRTTCEIDGVYQIVPDGSDGRIVTVKGGTIVQDRHNQPVNEDLTEVDSQTAEGVVNALCEFDGILYGTGLVSVCRLS